MEDQVELGVVCPYTGDPLRAEHVLGRGWVPVGTFDPASRRYPTRADAVVACLTRSGRKPKRDTKRIPRCPYSGARFILLRDNGEWKVLAPYKPLKVHKTLDGMRIELGTRNGVKPKLDRIRVSVVRDEGEITESDHVSDLVSPKGGAVDEMVDKLTTPRKIIVGG